jgi:predicted O-methyltransferase YrrM
MPSTLRSTPVSTLLRRLLTDEQESDPAAFTAARAAAPGETALRLDTARRAELFKDTYMSVSAEGGELLYLLARATGARTVVEYGTSFGVSTIYLAAAVRDNGGGTVIGTEIQRDKAATAWRNLTDAGVGDLVDLRVGDARETLVELPAAPDLVLLDGWPDLALAVLRVLEPSLRSGTLVLVDDVGQDFGGQFGEDVHIELLEHLADPANGYLSLRLPVADGIQAAVCLD